MIDYFIHFINKSLHFFAGKDTSSINHRSDRTDKLTDFFRTHTGLLSNPIERAFIIRHGFHIHLDFSSQLFGKIRKLLPHQVVMVLLLKIQCTYQFGKFERSICRFTYDGIIRCRLFAVNIIKRRMAIIVRYKAQRSGRCEIK